MRGARSMRACRSKSSRVATTRYSVSGERRPLSLSTCAMCEHAAWTTISSWSGSPMQVGRAARPGVHRDEVDGKPYHLLMMMPPDQDDATVAGAHSHARRSSSSTRSGSMHGVSMSQAKKRRAACARGTAAGATGSTSSTSIPHTTAPCIPYSVAGHRRATSATRREFRQPSCRRTVAPRCGRR